MIKLIILMSLQGLFLVISQVFLKIGLKNTDHITISFKCLYNILGNFYFWLTSIFMVLSGIIWLYVLKKYDFSVAYPLVSLSYIFGLLAAFYIFNEQIPLSRWVGVIIIILGIFLIMRN